MTDSTTPRDLFAAHALSGLLAGLCARLDPDVGLLSTDDTTFRLILAEPLARKTYIIADAMTEERKK